MKGMLMTPDNLKATIDRRKTQTRRVEASLREINKDPDAWEISKYDGEYTRACNGGFQFMHVPLIPNQLNLRAVKPRYSLNETVYLKEAWACPLLFDEMTGQKIEKTGIATIGIWYKYDDTQLDNPTAGSRGRWRSPLYMPEWAARYFTLITGVDIQRLNDITEDDAIAEGIPPFAPNGKVLSSTIPRKHFAVLWNSINEKPKYSKKDNCYYSYPWEDIREVREYRGKVWYVCGNPYVVVYSYRLVK